jgi:hypothetical protein
LTTKLQLSHRRSLFQQLTLVNPPNYYTLIPTLTNPVKRKTQINMRFSTIAAPLALAAGVNAWGSNYTSSPVSYVTDVVTEYTTYCPEATTLVENNQTYTVTSATTLTITNCPCTRVTPVYTTTSSVCTECAPPTVAPVAPVAPTTPPTNVSTSVAPVAPAFTGAAANLAVSGGALAGLLGVAAWLL